MEKQNKSDETTAIYISILNKFLPSSEIREYILHGNTCVDDITDIIFFSPAGFLDEKRDAIAKLLEIGDADEKILEKCRNAVLYLDKAMELLSEEGLFTLEARHFDETTKQQESDFEGIFLSYEDAKDEMTLWDENEDVWFELTLWEKNDKGKMEDVASFILVKGRPMYCRLEDELLENIKGFNEDYLWQFEMLSMTDLNLPVPYKAGDIVEVGSAPFVPRQRILITDVGDNKDCCCLQGFGKLSCGEYAVGAIKHGHVGYAKSDCYILPSLLYEMKKYDGKLPDEEQILNEVAWIIKSRE